MPERVHYSRAPITEALIDLRIVHSQGFSVDDLASIGDMLGDRYPNQEPMYLYSAQMSMPEVGNPMETETAHQHGGFSFTSQNKQHVFQARMDGFTFSTLAPYDRWESFRDEARRLWELYRSAAKAEGVTRAAVRYINRIDVPNATGGIRLEDYLRTYPEVSVDFPEEGIMSNFFMQLQLWQEDLGCWLVVNEAPDMPPAEDTMSVRLDFDLFREQYEEPWRTDDDTEVWNFLARLHDRKNEIFEASITNRTRRLIR